MRSLEDLEADMKRQTEINRGILDSMKSLDKRIATNSEEILLLLNALVPVAEFVATVGENSESRTVTRKAKELLMRFEALATKGVQL